MSFSKKPTSLAQAFGCACKGIYETIKNERNIKIELVFAVCALVAAALLALRPLEWALILILIVVVIALELANSALESCIDLVSPTLHPLAKRAKDAMAGAVLVAALGAVLAGSVIYLNAALRLWG